jgi:metal-responsive CopG/Arc/MetJ family transcriptional regulator
MSKSKIAITIDTTVLSNLDALVHGGRYPNRSRAFEAAAQAELARVHRTRLAAECMKLDAAEERALADEGLAADIAAWPAY